MINQIKQKLAQRKQKSLERKYKKTQGLILRKRSSGLTLIEVGLAVGIAALVIGAALYFYKTALIKSQAYSFTTITQSAISACESAVQDPGFKDCKQTLTDTGLDKTDLISDLKYTAGSGSGTSATVTVTYKNSASGTACTLLIAQLKKLNIVTDCKTATYTE